MNLHRDIRVGQAGLDAFARASGDCNPLHLDPVFARRGPAGGQTVYGMYLAAALLDLLAEHAGPLRLAHLDAEFVKPALAGAALRLGIDSEIEGRAIMTVHDGGRLLTCVNVEYAPAADRAGDASLAVAPDGISQTATDAVPQPRAWSADQLREGMEGASPAPDAAVARAALGLLFPHAQVRLASGQLAFLLALSRVVGMECPGKWALFWSAKVEFGGASQALPAPVHYRLVSIRKSMRLCTLEVYEDESTGEAGGPLAPQSSRARAQVQAFITEPPPYVAGWLEPPPEQADSLAGVRALVTGGSRGLGAALVGQLALRGARVAFSYHRGEAEAAAIEHALAAKGREAFGLRADLRDEAACGALVEGALARLGGLDLLINSASGPIRAWPFAQLALADLEEMLAFNVIAPFMLIRRALPLMGGGGTIVNISSIYAVEPPEHLGHYVAAKAAMEGLLKGLAAEAKHLALLNLRLRRFASDQTRHAFVPRRLPGADALAIAATAIIARQRGQPGYGEYALPAAEDGGNHG